ncbi:MAG: hypothetical protein ACOCYW_08825 [Roseicyclus sp.]
MRRRDPLATHNERVKQRATYLNALSLGFLGFAVLRPLIEGTLIVNVVTIAYLLTGLALHGLAHYILRYLEREE